MIIGGYESTFEETSNYIYKVQTFSNALFIRKANWLEILETASSD